jgi:integrase/recombinase XerC
MTTPDLISEYAQHLRNLERSGNTITGYIAILRRMDRELPYGLYAAMADELSDWIYIDGRASNTRALYRNAAAGFFRWAAGRGGYLDYDPTIQLPEIRIRAKRSRPPEDGILGEILAQAVGRYQLWLRLAAYGGLRCCELARLDRCDVTERAIWIHGKGDRERLVKTHPLIWELVEPLPPGPIALNVDGTPAGRESVSRSGNQYLQRTLGYPAVHMHLLRKWFGTQVYLASGKDIRAAQELLGHSRVTTTELYVAVSSSTCTKAVDALPVLVQPRPAVAQITRPRLAVDLSENLDARRSVGV